MDCDLCHKTSFVVPQEDHKQPSDTGSSECQRKAMLCKVCNGMHTSLGSSAYHFALVVSSECVLVRQEAKNHCREGLNGTLHSPIGFQGQKVDVDKIWGKDLIS